MNYRPSNVEYEVPFLNKDLGPATRVATMTEQYLLKAGSQLSRYGISQWLKPGMSTGESTYFVKNRNAVVVRVRAPQPYDKVAYPVYTFGFSVAGEDRFEINTDLKNLLGPFTAPAKQMKD